MGATAIAATVPDPKVFRSGRDFAAWIGIVPREDSMMQGLEAVLRKRGYPSVDDLKSGKK